MTPGFIPATLANQELTPGQVAPSYLVYLAGRLQVVHSPGERGVGLGRPS